MERLNHMHQVPRLIALCGNPKCGKSTVQEMLGEMFGHHPVDDGYPMRKFAMDNLGLTRDQVHTQEGKASFVEIAGKTWQVRDILGTLGNKLEEMFGAHCMPMLAVNGINPDPTMSFSFGSVRRDQGRYYQDRGGVVIGIRNPVAPPSNYEFDRFDETIVDAWIENDGQARGLEREESLLDLRRKVFLAVEAVSGLREDPARVAAAAADAKLRSTVNGAAAFGKPLPADFGRVAR